MLVLSVMNLHATIKRENMIFYNNLLAKWFLGKGKNKSHYFMFSGFFFT